MRRPRPHRPTGSARRLAAAAGTAALAAACMVTAATRTASAAPPALPSDTASVNLNLPVLPSLPLLPTRSAPPPSTSPGLPGGGLPLLCGASCTATNATTTVGGTGTGSSPQSGTPHHAASTRPRSDGLDVIRSAPSGVAVSTAGSSTLPETLELAVSPPPPVEQLTPLAGIAFGQAPYLWPLFALLDVVAAAAVVILVRRTWSRTPGVD